MVLTGPGRNSTRTPVSPLLLRVGSEVHLHESGCLGCYLQR